MRLIDADVLQKKFREECTHECAICRYGIYGCADFKGCDLICNAPTIEERPTGHWIEEPPKLPRCSECGTYSDDADREDGGFYCTHCGADMREEAEND